jgi:4-diphosphocytidyl-2-C-methyl-D-erythritol kinase
MLTTLSETARAKINLTLQVLGRREDSYHELLSLVVFAEAGDVVELDPHAPLGLSIRGPFADALGGDNLVLAAVGLAKARKPKVKLGHFQLLKQLPVAAGLGGGSADAAAALRLIARSSKGELVDADCAEIATQLGSDVSVCLASKPALMSGRGEKVAPVMGFPFCAVLLANPLLPLATAPVYAALRAKPLVVPLSPIEATDFGGDFEALISYLLPRGNDLEKPAAALVPEIREVLASLAALDGARIARLSGSGPTCFALFATEGEAKRGAVTLAASHPSWWIVPSVLG